LAFEIQELPDIIRVIILLDLSKRTALEKPLLKHEIDKVCAGFACVEMSDIDKALTNMASEGLVRYSENTVQLTQQGVKLGKEWQSLLLKKEPIIEVVAGLVDGSITGLVVILSAFIAGLTFKAAAFAALLTLGAVAITNFSSFLLGGITEDLADMLTLQNLMNYSLSDIVDHQERDKSLMLVKHLFTVLHKEISRANIIAAITCGTTTFMAGIIPIAAYLMLPRPYDIILSLAIVATIVGVFLVRYRSKRTKVHWKITLLETVVIIVLASVVSLLIGGIA
jgi:DNA-binding PadR family transcriptional regulator